MKLFTFRLFHPQAAEPEGVVATLPARSKRHAEEILSREFFFSQDVVNGHMFDVVFLRAAEIPASAVVDSVIVVQGPDGRVFEKAFK